VATVDDKAQVILDARAHGSGAELAMLIPAVEATAGFRNPDTALCADADYHSEDGLSYLAQQNIDAYVCDNDYRRHDPRFKDQGKHRAKTNPLYDKSVKSERIRLLRPEDFKLAPDRSHCICPAGKRLYANGRNSTINGFAPPSTAARSATACPVHTGPGACAFPTERRCGRWPSSAAGAHLVPQTE